MKSASDTMTVSIAKPKVLIVDDDPNLRMLLATAISDDGYEVVTAADGVEGLAQCRAIQPEIILLDAVMPQLDGMSCCREIHQHYGAIAQPCPPILMITARSDQGAVNQAFQAGADDFIPKPIHWPILRQRLKRCLANATLQQSLWQAEAEIQRLNLQLAAVGNYE